MKLIKPQRRWWNIMDFKQICREPHCQKEQPRYSIQHVEAMAVDLQNQARFFEKDNILFSPEQRNTFSKAVLPILSTDNIQTCLEDANKKAMVSHCCGNRCNKNGGGNNEYFVEFILWFFHKMTTTRRRTASVNYTFRAILPNRLIMTGQYLLEHEHKLVDFYQ